MRVGNFALYSLCPSLVKYVLEMFYVIVNLPESVREPKTTAYDLKRDLDFRVY